MVRRCQQGSDGLRHGLLPLSALRPPPTALRVTPRRRLAAPASPQPQRGDLFIAMRPPQGHSAPAERHVPPSEPRMPSAGRCRPATRPPCRSDGAWVTPTGRFYKQGAPTELAHVLVGVPGVGGFGMNNGLGSTIPGGGSGGTSRRFSWVKPLHVAMVLAERVAAARDANAGPASRR